MPHISDPFCSIFVTDELLFMIAENITDHINIIMKYQPDTRIDTTSLNQTFNQIFSQKTQFFFGDTYKNNPKER